MSKESNHSSNNPTSRTISHNQRDRSTDVNPLLQSSGATIISQDDNFVVGRQKSGQLRMITPGFKLSFREHWSNPIEKYYEVDKKTYPFITFFKGMPSAQTTFKFNVSVEFTLQVIDPCEIVNGNHTSLLECILLDLKRSVYDVTSRFMVQKSDEARLALQAALLSFACPSFLRMNCGVVDITADNAATAMLRQLEERNLEMALIEKKTAIDSAMVFSGKVTEAYQRVEDHVIQKHLPDLINQILPEQENS